MTEKHSRGRGPVAVAAGLVVGLLISGFTVWSASAAAFSATTDNTANQWHTANVHLTDSDSGSTMYNVTGLTPGSTAEERCITVTYDGDVTASSNVLLYGTGTTTASDLSNYLDMTIEVGTYTTAPTGFSCTGTGFSASATSYTGTLRNFMTTYHDWATGWATGWATPAANDTRMFRFTTTVQNTNSAIDKDVTGLAFTWEVRKS